MDDYAKKVLRKTTTVSSAGGFQTGASRGRHKASDFKKGQSKSRENPGDLEPGLEPPKSLTAKERKLWITMIQANAHITKADLILFHCWVSTAIKVEELNDHHAKFLKKFFYPQAEAGIIDDGTSKVNHQLLKNISETQKLFYLVSNQLGFNPVMRSRVDFNAGADKVNEHLDKAKKPKDASDIFGLDED